MFNYKLNKFTKIVIVVNNYFKHSSSIVSEKATIGNGSNIWHFSHIREGASIGKNVNIGQNVYIDKDVVIGDNCKIQNNVSIYKGVSIGQNVFVGPGVTFTNDLYPEINGWNEEKIIPTFVKDGVSIGANSTILCGVTLNESCLIGAGSVVTKDIKSNMIAFGNPAIEIKKNQS